jgi:bifunctional DNase/RNase
MTEVTVFRVWLNPRPDQGYVVIFKEAEGDRAIPMAIGVHEARAIQMAMDGVVLERPLTHDLFVSTLDELDTELLRVEIGEYRDSTYYADLVLQRGGETFRVDARPSDCAAIAVRCGAPILASDEVFQAADARVIQEEDGFTLVSGVESHTVQDPASGVDEGEGQGDLDTFRRIITDADLEEEDS